MRQVPIKPRYLVVGDGRLAGHVAEYLKLLDHDFVQWSRRENTWDDLLSQLPWCPIILLALRDDALTNFMNQLPLDDHQVIHFSGSQNIAGALGFHPLMTFHSGTYPLATYQKMAFVGTLPEESFREIFPSFTNPYFKIQEQDKALYHALCVLSGNGAHLLWDLVTREMETMGIQPEALWPYLDQVTKNIKSSTPGTMTGPWHRKDRQTIEKNRKALASLPELSLYDSLNELAQNLENP